MPERTARADRGRRRVDARLAIGLVLVAASTLGVWVVVEALDDGTEVLVAPATLTEGMRIAPGDLRTASVRLGSLSDAYLAPGDVPEEGVVVLRTVRAGEIVPAGAVADADSGRVATVVVPTRGPLSREIVAGAVVDLWTATELERGVFEPPAVLVGGAEVAAVVVDDGMVGGEGADVELLIPREKTAAVLAALASGDAVDLVPSGPVAGAG
ncbi:hypothetical protein [Agromyces sp. SYSU T0242]|uniref:hypothetical protein n=1 Tax=Agromyces litoreus TaxID=3158561 RepID=UPI003394A88B